MSQRTTLTIEDDVAEDLRAEARRTGRPLKDVVNDALRRGLAQGPQDNREPFRVEPRELGVRPEIDLDDVEGLLERIEGSDRR